MELLVRLGHFFEQARSDADYATFANELRRHQVSYYIYFVSTAI
ncbi:Phage envelope protein [Klebsiella pneumoniae]|nr:Phage envelope protein [Klebsiella pneumoniae]